MLLLGWLLKLDAARGQLFVRLFDVVAHERNVRKCPDASFMSRRREEYDASFAARNRKLNPTLPAAERLIGQDLKAEFLGVEAQSLILIRYRNTHELHRFYHGIRLSDQPGLCNPFLPAIALKDIGPRKTVSKIDDYVLDVLMRDLVGHDRSPSAYLVYLHLWSQTIGRRVKSARLSHQMVASATGLSKSAAQAGMRKLLRRRLVSVQRESATATPEYRVLRPWARRAKADAS
jgi:hypothetical protein